MTPTLLAQYLDTMRTRGVLNGILSFVDPNGNVVQMNIAFGPEAEPLPGDKPTPGGWKSPDRLDDPRQFDEVP